MKRRKLLAVLCACLCLTGCNNGGESAETTETAPAETTTTTTYPAIIAEEIKLVPESSFTDENSYVTESGVYTLVPDVPVNTTFDLAKVYVNGARIDIEGATLKQFCDRAGFARCEYGTTSITSKKFCFISGMFGVPPEEGYEFEGTLVSVEVIDENGKLVKGVDLKKDDYNKYKVKGIHVSEFFTRDDIFELSEGIKVGMPIDDLYDLLGEGKKLSDLIAYNNGTHTLAIEIDTIFNENDKPVKVIDGIYLWNNRVNEYNENSESNENNNVTDNEGE